MAFVAWCLDVPDSAAARQEHLQEHLEYIERHQRQILVAGPLKDGQGRMAGSLFVYDTEDEQAAQRLLQRDPYYKAQIWRSVETMKFEAAAGVWRGGLSWK